MSAASNLQLPRYLGRKTPPTREAMAQLWDELAAQDRLHHVPFKIETSADGRVIMSPVHYPHGLVHCEVTFLLRGMIKSGRCALDFGVATDKGILAPDVAWISEERHLAYGSLKANHVFSGAPELCIEILSPSNNKQEMTEKRSTYFACGAVEVWFAQLDGTVTFYSSDSAEPMGKSRLFPDFPSIVVIK